MTSQNNSHAQLRTDYDSALNPQWVKEVKKETIEVCRDVPALSQ